MAEYVLAIIASLIIAGIMVHLIDKKFGGTDEGNQG
jgi:hypothetical protein